MLAQVGAKCTLHAKRVRNVGELRQNVLESKWKSSRPPPENRDQCGATATAQPTVVPQHTYGGAAAAELRFFYCVSNKCQLPKQSLKSAQKTF